mmetsp:Transcript_10649/g.15589  ORF Transcript_10649/g.15589 Transcript_10649/m.15589 type:complete len:85 (-) Transcript_10649:72-326(-)
MVVKLKPLRKRRKKKDDKNGENHDEEERLPTQKTPNPNPPKRKINKRNCPHKDRKRILICGGQASEYRCSNCNLLLETRSGWSS